MLMNPSKILWQQKKKQANELIYVNYRNTIINY